VFLLLILLSGLLFFPDLDTDMQALFRVHFVHSVAVFMLSGLHLLVYNRHIESRQILRLNNPDTPYLQFPAWKSYTLYALKIVAMLLFLWFAVTKNFLI